MPIVISNNFFHITMLRFIILVLVFIPYIVFAQTNQDARKQLSSTIEALKASDARQKKIARENVKIEGELHSLQQETVALAKNSSEQEALLEDSEERLAILESQKKEKDALLTARRQELSTLVAAMIRLQELPPEAVIMMPGKLDETLETARTLNVVTKTIAEDAKSLKAQLAELEDLTQKIETNREAIIATKAELDKKHANLAEKIQERAKLQAGLEDEGAREKEQYAKLNAKSRSLQDLVDALGHEPQESPHYERDIKNSAAPAPTRHAARTLRSFTAAKGKLQMPVAGKIVRRYNEGGESAFSRGITFATPENANVLAPYDGEVVYAGNFRDYGRIVIIRHSDGYHTLLSGMEHINCAVGQFIIKGEPIGAMAEEQNERRLYMELRKDGKPVDPTAWF